MQFVAAGHVGFYSPQTQRGQDEPQPSHRQGNKLKELRWMMQEKLDLGVTPYFLLSAKPVFSAVTTTRVACVSVTEMQMLFHERRAISVPISCPLVKRRYPVGQSHPERF